MAAEVERVSGVWRVLGWGKELLIVLPGVLGLVILMHQNPADPNWLPYPWWWATGATIVIFLNFRWGGRLARRENLKWLRDNGYEWLDSPENLAAAKARGRLYLVRQFLSKKFLHWAIMVLPAGCPERNDISDFRKPHSLRFYEHTLVHKSDGLASKPITADLDWANRPPIPIPLTKIPIAQSWRLAPRAWAFGRETPRQAALIDASRCWGVIVAAWLAAEHFVPVWSADAFPSDNRAYVWYAAFAVMGVAFGAAIYFGRKAKGELDYRLLGRAAIQLAIGAGLVIVGTWAGIWGENTVGLIAIWLIVTASARILTLPWLPSLRQVFRRR